MKRSAALSAAWVVILMLAALDIYSVRAQEKVREQEQGPSLPKSYSTDKLDKGLGASNAAKVALVTPRGSFALTFVTTNKTCAVFEWANEAYDTTVTYRGYQSGFLYYQVQGWQIIIAIRNQAIDGTHDVYFFINGSSSSIFYARGIAYPAK
jgi:hypothetical protein